MFQPIVKRSATKLRVEIKQADELKEVRNRLQNVPLLLKNYDFTQQSDQENLPEVLIGDERRLKQVLINLVKNAKKFTTRGNIDILVAYDYEEECLYVHVKDTGRGIAAEDLSKLFTRFGKLQRTASSNSEGIGLGLNIVRSIVEKAGGEINVHSDGINQGSLFYLFMPMKAGRIE